MKGLRNAALLLSILLSARHDRANAQQTPSCPDTLDGFKKIDGVAFLHYAVVPSDPVGSGNGLLCARLEVDHEGWVGLAFSDDDKMNGSNAIIGITDEADGEGSVLKYDLAGYSPSVMPDEKQTLMDTSFYTVDGRTFLAFTKLLVEEGEIPIAEDGMNIFLHARGGNTLAYHGRDDRVVFDVNFASRPTPMITTDVSQTSKEVCSFCDDGITVDGDHPLFLGLTESEVDGSIALCQQLQGYANMLVSGSQECNDLDMNKMTCCPAPLEKGCSLCPDGINLDGNPFVGDNETAREDYFIMCQQNVNYASLFEAESDTCKEYTEWCEMQCCPAAVENPCTICPSGVVSADEHPLADFIANDVTDLAESLAFCDDTLDYYKLFDADSDTCKEEAVNMEQLCCPSESKNPCLVCPSGITLPSDDDMFDMCKQGVGYAKFSDEGTEMCIGLTTYEVVCCPVLAANPCSICPEGFFDGDIVAYDDDAAPVDLTCGDITPYIEEGSALCESTKEDLELTCCTALSDPTQALPSPTTSSNETQQPTDSTTHISQTSKEVCSFCDDGITVDGDHPLFLGLTESEVDESIALCQQLQGYANVFVLGSQECNDLDMNKMTCCPAPLEKGCSLCPDGINLDGNPFVGDNETTREDYFTMCQQNVNYASLFEAESDTCKEYTEWYEMQCCPAAVENPCTLCPSGVVSADEHPFASIIAKDETELTESLATCSGTIDYYKLFDADSDTCEQMREFTEMLCCPSESKNPCLVCPSGITLPSDDEMFDMCTESIEQAKTIEQGMEICNQMESLEVTCCPVLAANPCSICPEGYAIDEDSVVNDDDDAPVEFTCGDITPYIEEGSALCESTKEELKLTCCTALSDPIQALPSPASPEDPELITNPTLSSNASNVGQDLPSKEPSASAPALPSPTSHSSTAPKEPISVDQPSEESAVETRPTNKPTNATLSPNTSNDSQDLPSKEPSESRPGEDSNGDSQPSNKPSASRQASQSPTLDPTSAPSSVAPAMGILLTVSLLLVTSHAFAWIV